MENGDGNAVADAINQPEVQHFDEIAQPGEYARDDVQEGVDDAAIEEGSHVPRQPLRGLDEYSDINIIEIIAILQNRMQRTEEVFHWVGLARFERRPPIHHVSEPQTQQRHDERSRDRDDIEGRRLRVIIRQRSEGGGGFGQWQRLDDQMMKGVVIRREDGTEDREIGRHADESGADCKDGQDKQRQRHGEADDSLPQVGVFRRFTARLAAKGQRDLAHGVEGGHERRQRQQNEDQSVRAAAVLIQHQPGVCQDFVFGPEAGRDDRQTR